MASLLIRGGRVVDPAQGIDRIDDFYLGPGNLGGRAGGARFGDLELGCGLAHGLSGREEEKGDMHLVRSQ